MSNSICHKQYNTRKTEEKGVFQTGRTANERERRKKIPHGNQWDSFVWIQLGLECCLKFLKCTEATTIMNHMRENIQAMK